MVIRIVEVSGIRRASIRPKPKQLVRRKESYPVLASGCALRKAIIV